MNPDVAAAARGGALALALLVPGVVLGVVADAGSVLRSLSLVAVLAGFAVGGASAGRSAGHDVLNTGATAAGGAYVVVQAVGAVLRIGRGESVAWISFPFLALLAASVGMVGAWLATRRHDAADADADHRPDPGDGGDGA